MFWKDKWLGDAPSETLFPTLFSLANNKEATVKDCFEIINDKVVWGPTFRLQMDDWMVEDLIWLLKLLSNVFVVDRGINRRIWELDPHGNFSVSSFSKVLLTTNEVPIVHP